MRYMAVFLLLLQSCRFSSTSISEVKDLEDVASLVQLDDGTYLAACKDGSKEKATRQQVQTGDLCQKSDALMCTQQNGAFFPVRIQGGALLGQGSSEYDCQRSIANAQAGFVCVTQHGAWLPARIRDSSLVGNPAYGMEDCIQAVKQARNGLVCGYEDGFAPYSNTYRQRLGYPTDPTTCSLVLQSSRDNLVCGITPYGSFAPIRTSDGAILGEPRIREDCERSLQSAQPDVVCKGTPGGFAPTRIFDDLTLGQTLSLEDCTKVTGEARPGLLCTAEYGAFWPTSVAKASRLGTAGFDRDSCVRQVTNNREGVVCSLQHGAFTPTRFFDGQALFEGMSPYDCDRVVAAARQGLMCTVQHGAFAVTRIKTGERIGQPTGIDHCLSLLP